MVMVNMDTNDAASQDTSQITDDFKGTQKGAEEERPSDLLGDPSLPGQELREKILEVNH